MKKSRERVSEERGKPQDQPQQQTVAKTLAPISTASLTEQEVKQGTRQDDVVSPETVP